MPDAATAAGKGSDARFEQAVLPHMDSAYNLARWLVRNAHDAEDIVQEAFLRAYKFWSGFEGGDSRAWLLKIVRNTSYNFLERNRPAAHSEEFDEKLHSSVAAPSAVEDAETSLIRTVETRMLREALEELPVNFREILILRELEELSYKEISQMLEVPIGTVMSSLARGRHRLREILLRLRAREGTRGL